MKKKTLTKGMAAVMAFAMFTTISGSNLMFTFSNVVNSALNISTSKTIQIDEGEGITVMYDNPYGTDTGSKQATLQMEMDVAAENIRQVEEGVVLIRNENKALPLSSENKVTIFGNGSVNSIGTSDVTAFDAIPAVSFCSAMQAAFGENGVNTILADEVYSGLQTTTSSSIVEADIADIKKRESSWQSDYNDAAIVVLSRTGGEDNDNVFITEEGNHYLSLSKKEADLMNYLKEEKEKGVFEKIVVILNSEQMMELGWLEEYQVDACLQVGTTGAVGFTGLGNLLIGNVTPSGHLVDTYVKNSMSAPAVTYAGENTQSWTNTDWLNTVCTDNNNNGAALNYYTIYAEGIYVGYKYYETRYEDCVLGNGNAASSVGSSNGGSWNYEDEVVYPFGYGLSYTEFEQRLDSVLYNEKEDTYEVSVTVTNTGEVEGKSVVEVYAQTPYGDYEKQNKVEKSSVMLAGFEKTDTLQPGESVVITVPVERYLLASYDSQNAAGYILSAGDYYLSVGDNAHDALNNILAAKGKTTADGMDQNGSADKTYTWNQAEVDTSTYKNARFTGVEVTNQFDYADINYYGYAFTYLSRSDWEGTYPKEAAVFEANDKIVEKMNSDWYEVPENAPDVSDFTQGTDNGLSFAEMRNVDWEDEETWNQFIDQMTVEEMANLTLDGNGVAGVDNVGLPSVVRDDDGTGLSRAQLSAVGKNAMKWVSETMTARTWNKERFKARGFMLAMEATFCGVQEIWYGAGNIHRTPFGGRNRQYCSEDGNFGYYVTSEEARAMQEYGVTYCVKHMVMNDQETEREGISTFSNEQAIRENYLRPFEGAICKGGALSVMTSFNRLGSQACASCSELLLNVLKGEWGFKGHVTTDGYTSSQLYKRHFLEDYAAGCDYYCLDSSDHAAAVIEAINNGDGYILSRLREATKRNIYVVSRSIVQNGLNSNSIVVTVVPGWEKALLAATALFVIGFIICLAMTVVFSFEHKTDRRKEA